MSDRPRASRVGALAGWLIVAIWAATAVIAWFGYRATQEWRRSSELLVARRAEQAADLLLRALVRDMGGVEGSILRRLHWDQVELGAPYEISDAVASAFARYPYPESFFAWTGSEGADVMFFTRADRQPPWLPIVDSPRHFPVRIVRHAASARPLVERVAADAALGRRFSAFETTLARKPYHVVARLLYRAGSPDRLERVVGFVVDLEWVRASYFPELIDQVAAVVGGHEGLSMALIDERGRAIAGTPSPPGHAPVFARPLRPLFFDPVLLAALEPPPDLPRRTWTVQVSAADDPTLAFTLQVSDRSLIVTTAAAIVLGLGLLLSGRAVRASAELAQVRADFVSSVTHELKTPLATIRAVADTLVKRRISTNDQVQDYAQMLDQEAKRLTRLVDNLLAYSRVTDVSDVYSFEPIAPADLIDDVLRGFQPQFAHLGFDVRIDIPSDLGPLRGDRTALVLALDNLVDNAIRYSGGARWLRIVARRQDRMIHISISDRGIGIPDEEISRVVQRFARGRHGPGTGSGMGLAIANRVVSDHGGQLSIGSRVGEGTTVEVALPSAEV